MRSTWISGFYRFSTRKAGSLDIFRFRNFAVGGLRDWSIPGIEPSPCDSEAIRQLAQEQLESLVWQKAALYYSFRHPIPATSIRVSLKSRHRSNSKGGIQKEGLHATTVNPSRARYAVFCWRRLSPFDELQPRRTRPNFETRYSQSHPSGAGK